jgi:hypothetical protein
MKQINIRNVGFVALTAFAVAGCSLNKASNAVTSGQAAYNQTDPNASIPGTGSTSVATAQGVVGRLNRAFTGTTVSPMAGNYKTVLAQVVGNMPTTTNPTKAVGFDQGPIIEYAACADVSTTQIKSVYGVDTTLSIASQRANLIAAGLKITDAYVAGNASSGALSGQASAIFGTLVDACAGISGDTTQMTFIAVCMAATDFGVFGMGI